MTVLDLIELLRGQSVFDISTVAFAVLEVNGNLSVLLNTDEQAVKNKDMNIKAAEEGIQIPIICDGKIIDESLKALNIDMKSLNSKLKNKKMNCENVFLMTMDRYDNYNIIKKEGK